ncbi:MAG: DUF3859 domain-containing protein [Prolixibacteraceae bacterium]|jgi:hypothetical protein|nr:DUF3859 domain-containing protein [Prolixibacteraceae bacterium]
MAKKKIEVELYSYGEYSQWDRESSSIPKLINITNEIESELGTEFGYVLRIKKAKGKRNDFRIDHPAFKGEDGKVMDSFTGQVIINSNNYEFFLGDCIWAPLDDKLGVWTMTSKIDGEIIAVKSLLLKSKK